SAWSQQLPHLFEYGAGLVEMLERVNGGDHVGSLVRSCHELATVLDAPFLRVASRGFQQWLLNVQADDPSRSTLGHLDRLRALAAAEIDYGLAGNLTPDAPAEQRFQLALGRVSGAVHPTALAAGADAAQNPVPERSPDNAHGAVTDEGCDVPARAFC